MTAIAVDAEPAPGIGAVVHPGPGPRSGNRRVIGPRGRLAVLFTAETISMLGSKTSFFAVPWLVLVTTGSPEQMGLVAAAELVPYVLVPLLGAPLIDRVGPWRMSVGADLVSTVAMANVALAAARGAPGGLVTLALLVALAGGARGLADRARSVLLRPTVDAAGMDLTRATGIYDGIGRLSLVVGAPVGGLLIALLGPAGAVWLDAGSFALCALLVATGLRPANPPSADATAPGGDGAAPRPAEAGESDGTADIPARTPYLASLLDGVRFLWRDRLLFGLTAMFLVTNLCTQAAATVFIPLWVREVFDSAAGLGLVTGAFALGALTGNIAFTALAPRLPRYLALVLGSVVGGAPRLLVLAASTDLTVVLVVSFLSGVALASVNPIIGALLYERVPARLQARVFGVSAAISYAGLPLGGIIGGWAAQEVGLRSGLLLFGLVFLVASLLPVIRQASWRPLVDRPESAGAGPVRGVRPLGQVMMVAGGLGLLVVALPQVPASPWHAPASRWPVLLLIVVSLAAWITGVVVHYPSGRTHRTASPARTRPQQSAERSQPAERARPVELSPPAAEHDAGANRVTDLYVRAADQLGSDKAPIRLAGMYALERLAQDNPSHRQSSVEVLCAYLRTPYIPPDEDQRGERQVRLAAQRILARHLRPAQHEKSDPAYWGPLVLDLTEATLVDLDFTGCHLHHAVFDKVTFTGDTSFERATFTGDARFRDATFTGEARFDEATLNGARFDWLVAVARRAGRTGRA